MGRTKTLFQDERLRQFWNHDLHPITGFPTIEFSRDVEEEERKYHQQSIAIPRDANSTSQKK